MEREIMLSKKQAEADRREIENLNREKDILNKNLQKIQSKWSSTERQLNRIYFGRVFNMRKLLNGQQ